MLSWLSYAAAGPQGAPQACVHSVGSRVFSAKAREASRGLARTPQNAIQRLEGLGESVDDASLRELPVFLLVIGHA